MTTKRRRDIYRGSDPRERALYGAAHAAKLIGSPTATLRAWFLGQANRKGADFRPVLIPAATAPLRLSFFNLVEAQVLQAFRQDHGVTLPAVRQAIETAELKFGVTRLLLNKNLATDDVCMYLVHEYGRIANLNRSGQFAIKEVIQNRLRYVEWDNLPLPVRLYPSAESTAGDKVVMIDPRVAFGQPVLANSAVPTAVISSRVDAGDEIEEIAEDYGISEQEVRAALVFRAA